MLKKKCMSCLLIACFMMFVFVPADYAAADPIDEIVEQIRLMYSFADVDYENYNIPAIKAAAKAAEELTPEQKDEIAGPLVTPEVTAKYEGTDLYDKEEWDRLIVSLLVFNYIANPGATQLKEDLEEFREEFSPHFKILFGDEITMEDLARLAQDAKSQIKSVVGKPNAGLLATGSNAEMIEKMTGFSYDAVDAAAELPGNEMFQGKLAELKWDKGLLLQQLNILSGYIDESGDARRSTALIAIRSETEMEGPLTLEVGDKPEYTVKIMGENASSLVAWDSLNPDVVKVTTEKETGKFNLEAIGPGTAELIIYRDYEGADPDYDWLYRFEVEVEGLACMYGDVNCDGDVDIVDLVLVARHIAGTIEFDDQQKIIANVDGSDVIDIVDLVLIARHIAGTLETFPVELP